MMKKIALSWTLSLGLLPIVFAQTNSSLKLWYQQPAREWVEALPIGNGRIGAMVYGDPQNEKIQLNESTVWAGQPNRNDNPEAREALPEVRRLVFEGKYKEAQELVNKKFISKTSHGMPYQTVGNLYLHFPGHENYSNYYRELDIEKAIVTTRYAIEGVNYETKIFSSFPDQVIIARLTGDKPGSINFSASMSRPSGIKVFTKGDNEIILSGVTGDHDRVEGKVVFQAMVRIVTTGGRVSANDTALFVTSANAATIYISISSNFKSYNDIGADATQRCSAYLEKAVRKNYDQSLKQHVSDYQRY